MLLALPGGGSAARSAVPPVPMPARPGVRALPHGVPLAADGLPTRQRPPLHPAAAVLVVLVDFPGQPPRGLGGRHPVAAAYNRYFGTAPDSVRSFFLDNSYGQFGITGEVVGGAAAGEDSVWLTAPHYLSYYVNRDNGLAASGPNDITLCQDVVTALDNAGFNWKPFETKDGSIPYLVLVPDVPDGAATGSVRDLWSTEWPDQSIPVADGRSQGTVVSFDVVAGVGVQRGEFIPLGTAAHEFAHLLGLPDLFDTSGRSAGLGNWSLMGTGAWDGPDEDAAEPADLDAFSRWYLGWARATLVTHDTILHLPAVETASRVAMLYPGGGTSGPEYFLLENREGSAGPADGALPGKGLLVYRVATSVMTATSPYWQDNTVDAYPHTLDAPPWPGIELVRADGEGPLTIDDGSAGDPFPGSADVRRLVPTGDPRPLGLDGQPVDLWITGISDPGPVMTLTVTFRGVPKQAAAG
jgi:immune inhibitor A